MLKYCNNASSINISSRRWIGAGRPGTYNGSGCSGVNLILSSVYNLDQSDVWQAHRGIQPDIPQVAFFGQPLGNKFPMKIVWKIPVYRFHFFQDPSFPGSEVEKFHHHFLFGEVSNQKNPYRSLELGTRVLSNPEMGDMLVCPFFIK